MKDLFQKKYIPAWIGGGMVLIVVILVIVFRDAFDKGTQTKKQIQQIAIVQPPPPPPPPPPQPEIKPPEVKEEKIPEPEPEPEPEPQAEEPPPGQDLGVDSEGGAGSDGFGLVGKKGGAGLLGGGGGNAILFYGQQVQKKLVEELDRGLREKGYRSRFTAVVHLWFSPGGDISRVELDNSSGTAEIDEAIKSVLMGIRGGWGEPPPKMPQPLKVRIRS